MRSDHEVFLRVITLADGLTRRLGEALEPFRLTLSQYSVLEALRRADDDGLACGEIAQRLLTRDPDITRLLDRLEDRGLVLRRRERPDRRIVRTHITSEGLQLLKTLDEALGRLQARHLGHMSRRNLSTLTALLETAAVAV
jgi:DNA-binding MarR family transcriptional regulator